MPGSEKRPGHPADTAIRDSSGNIIGVHGDPPCPPPPEDDTAILEWMTQNLSDPFQPGVLPSTGVVNGGTVSLTPSKPQPNTDPCANSTLSATGVNIRERIAVTNSVTNPLPRLCGV